MRVCCFFSRLSFAVKISGYSVPKKRKPQSSLTLIYYPGCCLAENLNAWMLSSLKPESQDAVFTFPLLTYAESREGKKKTIRALDLSVTPLFSQKDSLFVEPSMLTNVSLDWGILWDFAARVDLGLLLPTSWPSGRVGKEGSLTPTLQNLNTLYSAQLIKPVSR